ncbi:hypothetical protein [Marinifilum caeruleilacunae]|uniref:PH domain-containing protein n=1 Tax=Marinifilum caeruleilacunae TaxID=2499076 RepID=A0ABX1WVJ8_9BACT|nr:hypothetical protein [Marinifilum caeruleilacunae]NOU59930.1 hypothetical protein [Marinifilum caeruleilacunae]
MISNYKTGKLPPNFMMLGILFLFIGIVIILDEGLAGIMFILLALPFLLTHSGLSIDLEKQQIRKFTSLLGIKFGSWIDVSGTSKLLIGKIRQNKGMAVLSISRNEISFTYKLYAIIDNRRCEIVSGNYDFVKDVAKQISDRTGAQIKSAEK